MSALTDLFDAVDKLRAALPLVGIVCRPEHETRLRAEVAKITGQTVMLHTPIEVCVKTDQEEPFKLFYNHAEMLRYLAGKTIKYVLVPGHVRSARDGIRRWVSSHELPGLYKVDPLECIAYPGGVVVKPEHRHLPILPPRADGIYKLPE